MKSIFGSCSLNEWDWSRSFCAAKEEKPPLRVFKEEKDRLKDPKDLDPSVSHSESQGSSVTEASIQLPLEDISVPEVLQRLPPARDPRSPVAQNGNQESEMWVQCDLCDKWRRLERLNATERRLVSNRVSWNCMMNVWDPVHDNCKAPEELTSEPRERDKPAVSPHASPFASMVATAIIDKRPFPVVAAQWVRLAHETAVAGVTGDLLRELAAVWVLLGQGDETEAATLRAVEVFRPEHLRTLLRACQAVNPAQYLQQFESESSTSSYTDVLHHALRDIHENPLFVSSVCSTPLIRLLAPIQFSGIYIMLSAFFPEVAVFDDRLWLCLPASFYTDQIDSYGVEVDAARRGLVKEQIFAQLDDGADMKWVLSNPANPACVVRPGSLELLQAAPFKSVRSGDAGVDSAIEEARKAPLMSGGFAVQTEPRVRRSERIGFSGPASCLADTPEYEKARRISETSPTLSRSLPKLTKTQVQVREDAKAPGCASKDTACKLQPARHVYGGPYSRTLETFVNLQLLRSSQRLATALLAECQARGLDPFACD